MVTYGGNIQKDISDNDHDDDDRDDDMDNDRSGANLAAH